VSARRPAEVEKTEKESGRRRDAFGKSEVVLVVVDSRASAIDPGDILTVRLLCTNGSDPAALSFPAGKERAQASHFQAEIAGVYRVMCVLPPGKSFPPPSDDNPLWQLIAQLSLNHRSLVDEGPGPLKSLLSLHNLTKSQTAAQAVEGIRGLACAPDFARVDSERGPVFVRGKRIEIELDEDQHFQDSGVYLFGAVLDRFFGAWTSMNSFTQLRIATPRREVAEFPPRAGNRVVA
jgi:type VI secretion system protein ImpG